MKGEQRGDEAATAWLVGIGLTLDNGAAVPLDANRVPGALVDAFRILIADLHVRIGVGWQCQMGPRRVRALRLGILTRRCRVIGVLTPGSAAVAGRRIGPSTPATRLTTAL